MITIYTDGSCLTNPGDGGWAAIIHDEKEIRKISGSEKTLQIIEWSYLLQLMH